MRSLLRTRRERGTYTVTDAKRPMSEDIAYRQRRYLISMGIRTVAFLLAVFLFHGVWRFVAAGLALVLPYFAVVFANGGREPEDAVRFESFRPRVPGDAADPRAPLAPGGSPRTPRGNDSDAAWNGAAEDGTAGVGTDHADGTASPGYGGADHAEGTAGRGYRVADHGDHAGPAPSR